MNRSRQTISVIVPAYNAATTIAGCVESLLGQTMAPAEVIVVDDCSRDATAEVAARYGVTLIRLARNSGPGVARNAGAAVARGDILAFTDSDCVAPAHWLERMAAALDEPPVVAATGGYAGPLRPAFLTRLQHLVLRERQAGLPRKIQSTISSNLVCRKGAFQAVGGFPLYYSRRHAAKPIWGNEDEELGFLLTRAGGEIRWVADTGVFHAFRQDLLGYLRQQRFYAHSILVSHLRFREMTRTQSNYSRSSGAAQVVAAFGVALGASGVGVGALLPDEVVASGMLALLYADGLQWIASGLLAIAAPVYLLSPVPMLKGLRRRGERLGFLLRAYPVLLAVPMAWLTGAVSGAFSSLGGFVDGNCKRHRAPAAADR